MSADNVVPFRSRKDPVDADESPLPLVRVWVIKPDGTREAFSSQTVTMNYSDGVK